MIFFVVTFQVNGYILRGSNSAIFIIPSHLESARTGKESKKKVVMQVVSL